MKIAIILSTVYAILFTASVFDFAETDASMLRAELDRARSHARTWRLVTGPEAKVHTLFSGAHAADLRKTQDKTTHEIPSSVSRPSGLTTVATVSACNPRISPCF